MYQLLSKQCQKTEVKYWNNLLPNAVLKKKKKINKRETALLFNFVSENDLSPNLNHKQKQCKMD